MVRVNYTLVSGRFSKTSIHRKGRRPTKPKPYAKLAADIGVAAVIKIRQRLHRAARRRTVVWMEMDPTSCADNLERPGLNISGPGVDAPTGTVSASLVEALPVFSRKRKAEEAFPESSIIPPTKKARMDLPTSSTESSISSRKAEKARARDDPVEIPLISLRKAEKARARDDSAEPINAISSASLETVKESRLLTPIRRLIVTENMASSSKVKLEDIPPRAPAIVKLFAPILVDVQSSVLPPRGSTMVGQPVHSNDAEDVIMIEDDYILVMAVEMLEDDYVEVPPMIGGYDPEYGDHMQIDSVGVAATRNDRVPFGAGPVNMFAMLGYVPEFTEAMEVEWLGPSIPSGNRLGNAEANPIIVEDMVVEETSVVPVMNGAFQAQTNLNVLPTNTVTVDAPYDPREPLFAPRPQVPPMHVVHQVVEDNFFMKINVHIPGPVQRLTQGALNGPEIIPAEEQPIGHGDEREELFNELFGDDVAEEDEEEEEAGTPDALWTAAGDDLGDAEEDAEEEELGIVL